MREDVADNLILLHRQLQGHAFTASTRPVTPQVVYSYFESRGGRFPVVVFFGLQYYLERYLAGAVVTAEKIDAAERFCSAHFQRGDPSFNRAGWEHVLHAHGGRLPVRIHAVPEGTPLPVRNVLLTVENTDPACCWLTSYLETLLVQLWYPEHRGVQSPGDEHLIAPPPGKTGTRAFDFKLHDFGCRGVSSMEIGGGRGSRASDELPGTDTMPASAAGAALLWRGDGGLLDPGGRALDDDGLGRGARARRLPPHAREFSRGMVAVSATPTTSSVPAATWGRRPERRVLHGRGPW